MTYNVFSGTLNPAQSIKTRFALTPISTLVRPGLVTGFKQHLQINDFITLYMLPFIPLLFLCTHFWQLVHCIELLPTPLPHTPHGPLAAFCNGFWRSPLIITLLYVVATLGILYCHNAGCITIVMQPAYSRNAIVVQAAYNRMHLA